MFDVYRNNKCRISNIVKKNKKIYNSDCTKTYVRKPEGV